METTFDLVMINKQESDAELIDLQQKIEILMRNTEEPFVLVDRQLNIVTFNEEFKYQYFKYFSVQVSKGHSILDYAKSGKEIVKEIYKKAFEGIRTETELNITVTENLSHTVLIKYKPALNEKGGIFGVFVSIIDITEKKRALESHNRFQSLIENASEIITLTDKDGKIIYLSPSVHKITGYNVEDLTHIKNFVDKMNTDAQADSNSLLEDVLKQPGVPIYRLVNLIHKNHYSIWLEGTITNLLHDKNVKAIVSNFRDITEKKAAESKLKESENNLRAVFDNSTEGLILLDKDGVIKAFNSKADNNNLILNKRLQVGEILLDYILEERRAYFKDYLSQVLKGNTIEYDIDYKNSDGSLTWFHATLNPVRENNKITGICIARRDITEKKLAEESIQIAKERYDIVAKATNDAIYDWNLQTDELIRTGDGLKVLFGYDAEEAKEKNFWRNRIHPGDIENVTKKLEHLLLKPDNFYCNQEYRFLKADGTYAFVFDKGFIIRNSSGEAIRMIGATQDITHRKETELLLKNLNDNLEARAKELADSNTELEQFAYTASHDLQEPLRMITSFLNQLQLKYKDQLDDKAQQYIYFASDGASRLRKIILDLLEYSLAGKKNIDLEVLDTEMLLVESIQLLRKTIEEKNADIQYGPMPTLPANKSSILQVFQNLIGNGLKYQKNGQKPVITINAVETATHWQFSFADNGIGVETQFFEKIFVAFHRLHNRSEYAGTGLGLAICKKIIENHGGKIWLESIVGEGSIFYFTLLKPPL
ncbi:MAG: PAS domain S-box protein [Bacteroidia bacterium]|nr:PAS domain S-box protein [Bacteroidia bacterium]